MVWDGTEIVLVESKMNSVLYQDTLPGSLLPVTPLITTEDWTLQQINASDVYSVLYKVLYEAESEKNFSMVISESRPESNGRPSGHSGSRFLQEGRQYRSKPDLKTEIKNC
ncbi:hypothetical protein AVEN_51856-1 [Araneus ventricosus]|uniref:Uncharacterized protein n=1 Tax=Araneus ventricosus TaxID=182803 RepID=A0A4Y2IVT2_ARAVE|nr:hypothetical protein AVEN_51856-1 [Araneus ventricosus]